MRLADYIDSRLVLVDFAADGERQLFEPLVERLCSVHTQLDKKMILDGLLERERKYSTGLESGVAVPHALVAGIEKPVCLVARLAEPLEYGTLDGSPVRILFLLVSPQDALATHIRVLARIARLCTLPDFLEHMLAAADATALYDTIVEEDGRHV